MRRPAATGESYISASIGRRDRIQSSMRCMRDPAGWLLRLWSSPTQTRLPSACFRTCQALRRLKSGRMASRNWRLNSLLSTVGQAIGSAARNVVPVIGPIKMRATVSRHDSQNAVFRFAANIVNSASSLWMCFTLLSCRELESANSISSLLSWIRFWCSGFHLSLTFVVGNEGSCGGRFFPLLYA